MQEMELLKATAHGNGTTVFNVTCVNIFLRGIYARSGGTGFNFHNNIVQNVAGCDNSIAMFNYGGSGIFANNTVSLANDAISANWSTGTQFLNNTITNSGSGIHTDNAGGSSPDIIQGNFVSNSPVGGYGIFSFFPYTAPTIMNNTITNVDIGLFAWGGQSTPVVTNFTNNVVDGQNKANSIGIYVSVGDPAWQSYQGNVAANFTNNSVKNFTQDFWIEQFTGYTASTVAHNNSFTNSTQGFGSNGPVVNATNNWWGDVSGPYNAASNPSGLGIPVSNNVTFSPWTGESPYSPSTQTVNSVNTNYTFGTTGVTMNYSTLAPGQVLMLWCHVRLHLQAVRRILRLLLVQLLRCF